MADNAHIPGGEGELPIGTAKAQAKAVWDDVKTPAAWAALTSAQKLETVRKFIKYAMMRFFGFA